MSDLFLMIRDVMLTTKPPNTHRVSVIVVMRIDTKRSANLARPTLQDSVLDCQSHHCVNKNLVRIFDPPTSNARICTKALSMPVHLAVVFGHTRFPARDAVALGDLLQLPPPLPANWLTHAVKYTTTFLLTRFRQGDKLSLVMNIRAPRSRKLVAIAPVLADRPADMEGRKTSPTRNSRTMSGHPQR